MRPTIDFPPHLALAFVETDVAYIDPGAGGLLLQALGGFLIGLVAFVGKVRRFVAQLFTRGPRPE